MHKQIKSVLTLITATTLMFSSCSTKKTAEETEAPTTTSEVDVETTEVSEEVIESETSETTIAFDINDYTFDTIHGSQLNCYLNHQYYFAKQAIPVTESNYYFIKAFLQLSEDALKYDYYPVTSEGYIDLAAEIPAGDNGEAPLYKTYGDMFKSYAETSLYSTYIILDNAKAIGITLGNEDLQKIEDTISSIETEEALAAGMTLEDYLKVYYGPDCTVDAFRQVLTNFYINDAFTKYYLENFDYGDMPTIMSPIIKFASFVLSDYGAVMTDASEEVSGEGNEEAKLKAQAAAQAMYDQCNGSIDAFGEIGSEAYANDECSLYGEVALIQGQVQIADVVDEWCLSPERIPGDMEIIYVEAYGYVLVGFVNIVENQDAMEQIAVENLTKQVNANIVNNTYAFHTNDDFLPPPTIAPESEQVTVEENAQPEEVITGEETGVTEEITENTVVETEDEVQDPEEASSNHDVVLIIGLVLCLMILVLLIILFVRVSSNKKKTVENEEEIEEEIEEES
ncbi:MAG: hypothetical protein MJ153_05305 [Clostridia bacterium]|nr:hypothetical protein [Clostridia bacterium]